MMSKNGIYACKNVVETCWKHDDMILRCLLIFSTAAKFLRTESVKCLARVVIAKSRARHVHVVSLDLHTSRKSPLIWPWTTDESLHFCSSFRKPKRFRLLSICANTVYNEIQPLEDTSSIRIICKDILHETLKYVDEFSEFKKWRD